MEPQLLLIAFFYVSVPTFAVLTTRETDDNLEKKTEETEKLISHKSWGTFQLFARKQLCQFFLFAHLPVFFSFANMYIPLGNNTGNGQDANRTILMFIARFTDQ